VARSLHLLYICDRYILFVLILRIELCFIGGNLHTIPVRGKVPVPIPILLFENGTYFLCIPPVLALSLVRKDAKPCILIGNPFLPREESCEEVDVCDVFTLLLDALEHIIIGLEARHVCIDVLSNGRKRGLGDL
jgi:hypothetical protein